MSEDTKVIDFESRAAQQRAMHTGYLVTELDGPTLKGIFGCGIHRRARRRRRDCIVRDDITLVATADSGKDHFKVYAFFPTDGTREQALEFCNLFNLHLVVVRAQVRDTPDADGQWTVIFDYDRLVFEDERIEAMDDREDGAAVRGDRAQRVARFRRRQVVWKRDVKFAADRRSACQLKPISECRGLSSRTHRNALRGASQPPPSDTL